MAALKMPHRGHEKHLCYLQNVGYVEFYLEKYKKLVRDAKYVCKHCGRVAADSKSLCEPELLY